MVQSVSPLSPQRVGVPMVRLCSLSSPKIKEQNSGNQSPQVCEHPPFASRLSVPKDALAFSSCDNGRVLPISSLLGAEAVFSTHYVFGTVMLLSVETMPSGKEQGWGVGNHGMTPSLSSKSIPTYYPLISPSGRGDQPLTPRSLMGFLNQANHKIHLLYQMLRIHVMSF